MIDNSGTVNAPRLWIASVENSGSFPKKELYPGSLIPAGTRSRTMKEIWVGFSVALLLVEIVALPASPMPATTFESDETQSTLIELFTSEGCSSCPPAEKWMSALKSNQDLWKTIIPVAFHVDYWDRLGWRDRFAKPEFTSRQQRYAAAWGGDSVYTPSFVVNGKEWRSWFGGNAVPTTSSKIGMLRVSLGDGGKLSASFIPERPQPRTLALNVALLGNDLESDVKRGENRGRKLRHDFVVLDLIKTDMTSASNGWTASVVLPMRSGDKPSALAAWLTENGTPVQATGGWLKP
jgi:hypothetical protein